MTGVQTCALPIFTLPDEYESYAALSEDMRAVYKKQKRRIPILHRNGGVYLLSPGDERLRRMSFERLKKFGHYIS